MVDYHKATDLFNLSIVIKNIYAIANLLISNHVSNIYMYVTINIFKKVCCYVT